MEIMSVKVVDYFDVWGNQEEGYDINDQREIGIYSIEGKDYYEVEDEDLFNLLVSLELFKEGVTFEDVVFDLAGDLYVEVRDKATDMPLFGIHIED